MTTSSPSTQYSRKSQPGSTCSAHHHTKMWWESANKGQEAWYPNGCPATKHTLECFFLTNGTENMLYAKVELTTAEANERSKQHRITSQRYNSGHLSVADFKSKEKKCCSPTKRSRGFVWSNVPSAGIWRRTSISQSWTGWWSLWLI